MLQDPALRDPSSDDDFARTHLLAFTEHTPGQLVTGANGNYFEWGDARHSALVKDAFSRAGSQAAEKIASVIDDRVRAGHCVLPFAELMELCGATSDRTANESLFSLCVGLPMMLPKFQAKSRKGKSRPLPSRTAECLHFSDFVTPSGSQCTLRSLVQHVWAEGCLPRPAGLLSSSEVAATEWHTPATVTAAGAVIAVAERRSVPPVPPLVGDVYKRFTLDRFGDCGWRAIVAAIKANWWLRMGMPPDGITTAALHRLVSESLTLEDVASMLACGGGLNDLTDFLRRLGGRDAAPEAQLDNLKKWMLSTDKHVYQMDELVLSRLASLFGFVALVIQQSSASSLQHTLTATHSEPETTPRGFIILMHTSGGEFGGGALGTTGRGAAKRGDLVRHHRHAPAARAVYQRRLFPAVCGITEVCVDFGGDEPRATPCLPDAEDEDAGTVGSNRSRHRNHRGSTRRR